MRAWVGWRRTSIRNASALPYVPASKVGNLSGSGGIHEIRARLRLANQFPPQVTPDSGG